MTWAHAGQYGAEGVGDSNGRPLPGQPVHVYQPDGTTTATLYADRTKGSTIANPTTADSNGNLTLWLEPGQYVLSMVVGGRTVAEGITVLPDPADLAVFGATVALSPAVGDLLVWSGTAWTTAHWQGVWAGGTTYNVGDRVAYGSPVSSYLAISASTAVIPGTDVTKWQLLAQAGANGGTQVIAPQQLFSDVTGFTTTSYADIGLSQAPNTTSQIKLRLSGQFDLAAGSSTAVNLTYGLTVTIIDDLSTIVAIQQFKVFLPGGGTLPGSFSLLDGAIFCEAIVTPASSARTYRAQAKLLRTGTGVTGTIMGGAATSGSAGGTKLETLAP